MTSYNCTDGETFCMRASEDESYITRHALSLQIFAISLLIFTCLFGNLLLCFAVYKTSKKPTASTIFILNLVVTDILVGSLVLPFWILSTASLSWPLSRAVCEFTAFLTVSLMQCSIFSLSGIAVDRYFSIRHPLRYPIEATMNRVSLVVAGIWLFCVCTATFPIYGWGDYRFQPQTIPICNPEYISQVSFSIFFVLFGMGLPLALMLFSYIRILQIARDHIRKIESLKMTFVKPVQGNVGLSSGFESPNGSRRHAIENKQSLSTKFSKNIKAVRKVFIAVGVFFLCWGPYVILNFWSVNNEQVPVPYLADLLTTLLAFANSSANPVIFIVLNKDFRRVIKRLARSVMCITSPSNMAENSDVVTYFEKSDRVRTVATGGHDSFLLRVEDLEQNSSVNNDDIKGNMKDDRTTFGAGGKRPKSTVRFQITAPSLPGVV